MITAFTDRRAVSSKGSSDSRATGWLVRRVILPWTAGSTL
jgi:hypothetical protein